MRTLPCVPSRHRLPARKCASGCGRQRAWGAPEYPSFGAVYVYGFAAGFDLSSLVPCLLTSRGAGFADFLPQHFLRIADALVLVWVGRTKSADVRGHLAEHLPVGTS